MQNKIYISAGLVILIIVALNFVSNEFHFRLDLTEDHEYTLSQATKDILDDLEDPVTVKAYFSQDLPPNIAQTRTEFQEMLVEYANRSDGKVVYEFINPNEKPETEQAAMQSGIRPVMITVREKDQAKQQKAFLGAELSFGGKKETIPVIEPGAAMEYALSTAIKKLSVNEKPAIGFLTGHGEAGINEMPQAAEELSILYNAQDVQLSDTTDIPANIKTLAIIRPADSIPYAHFQKIESFLQRGGRIFVGINRVEGNLQSAMGTAVNTGLEKWLKEKGVDVQDDFVVDAECGVIGLQQQTPFGMMTQQLSFPYLPVISTFSSHPISGGLEGVLLKFASTISFTGDSTKHFTPLAFTSDKSDALKAPQYFEVQKQWTEADFPKQNLVVAGLVEGKLSGNVNSKMVVVADGDFPVNGAGEQVQRLQDDNVNLLVNSIDWLSDDTGLIALRTKGAVVRPIKQMDESTKTLLKYGNFLLPVLLAIGYGVYRSQRNKMKRYRWMSENYE